MPVRRLVGVPPRRTGPTGAASPVGPDGARTPRCFGARLLLRGFQGGDLLRQSLGTVSGVVVVRVDRRCRTHEQPCGTHPPLGRAVAQEFLWLPQRGGVSVRGADVDRGTNPAVAETSGARLPVSRDRSPSIRPSRSAITGPGRGLNGYLYSSMSRSTEEPCRHGSCSSFRSSEEPPCRIYHFRHWLSDMSQLGRLPVGSLRALAVARVGVSDRRALLQWGAGWRAKKNSSLLDMPFAAPWHAGCFTLRRGFTTRRRKA